MISPELLRRFPFFGPLDDAELRAIAVVSELEEVNPGTNVFQEGQPAAFLYLAVNGSFDLFFTVEEENRPEVRKELFAGEINPGEVFGISALIEPYSYTATARAPHPCQVIKINAEGLRDLDKTNPTFCCRLLHQMAKTALERLQAARIQLAAAWA